MQTSRYFVFEPFRLDVLDERLWDGNKNIRLGRKAFAVLHRLLSQSGQLVTKDDLLAAAWPDTAVSDAALTTAIREVREALGEPGRAPRFIQTVHGRGYRFIAAVILEDASTIAPTTEAHHLATGSPSVVGSPRGLVGRDAEWAKLHEWYAIMQHGNRRIGFIAGEAGIGKSTLVEAFVSDPAVRSRAQIGRGQCVEHYGVGEAYMPMLEALARLGRDTALPIADVLRRHAPSWLVHLPSLALGREHNSSIPVTPERMLRELADALDILTARDPLILVLEDLHWSDHATLEWLAYTARRRDPAHLLILATYRPVEALLHMRALRNLVADLRRHPQCEELVLDYLPGDSVEIYLRERCGDIAGLKELAGVLRHRTGGHPLFLTMILDDLLRRGLVKVDDAAGPPSADLQAISKVIPVNVRHFIEHLFEQLSPEDQRILEAASAAGESFPVAVVAAAVSAPEETIEARCSAWVREGQLLIAGDSVACADSLARYRFRHAMYQEVVHDRMSPERCARLHRCIGECLESAYGRRAATMATELAMHFEYGREFQKAVLYLEGAARGAIERSAYSEARRHLTRGLELLPMLPEGRERRCQELELMLLHGQVLKATEGWSVDEVEGVYSQAHKISEELGEHSQLLQATWGLIGVTVVRAQLETTQALAREMLKLANKRQDPAARMAAHMELGGTAFALGDPSARENFERAEGLYGISGQESHIARFGVDVGLFSRIWATHLEWHQGFPERARAKSEETVRLSEKLSHPFTRAITLAYAAMLHQFWRDLEGLDHLAQAAIAHAGEYGFPYYAAWAELLQGWSRAARSSGEEGIPEILCGIETLQKTAGLRLPYYRVLLAEAYGWSGRIADALQTLDVAWSEIQRTQERWWEAELHRLRGELLRSEGVNRTAEAERCFRRAAEVARIQQAKSLELRAAVSLGRLLRDRGRPADARPLLAEVYNWFTEGFDTPDLNEARGLLEELTA